MLLSSFFFPNQFIHCALSFYLIPASETFPTYNIFLRGRKGDRMHFLGLGIPKRHGGHHLHPPRLTWQAPRRYTPREEGERKGEREGGKVRERERPRSSDFLLLPCVSLVSSPWLQSVAGWVLFLHRPLPLPYKGVRARGRNARWNPEVSRGGSGYVIYLPRLCVLILVRQDGRIWFLAE